MAPTNEQIAELFENMGSLLEMKGDTIFKIRAYQRAARTIEQLSSPLSQALENGEDLTKIPGVGKAISEKIAEFIGHGQVSAYEKLLEELPPRRARPQRHPRHRSQDCHGHRSRVGHQYSGRSG